MSTYSGTSVCIIANVDKLVDAWRVDFLVFGGDQKAAYTKKLQVGASDCFTFQVTIDEVNGQEKSFGNKLELHVDFDQPVDQNGAHLFVDMRLSIFHVDGKDSSQSFLLTKDLVHILNVVSGTKRIIDTSLINIVNLSRVLVARSRAREIGDPWLRNCRYRLRLKAKRKMLRSRDEGVLLCLIDGSTEGTVWSRVRIHHYFNFGGLVLQLLVIASMHARFATVVAAAAAIGVRHILLSSLIQKTKGGDEYDEGE